MSFDNIQSEPKKTYLNNLINLYFQTAMNLVGSGNFTFGLRAIRALLLIVPNKPQNIVEPLRAKALQYMNNGQTEEELYQLFQETGAFLNEHYFSELHLGIVPTSTLPGEKPKPSNEPIKETASSRL